MGQRLASPTLLLYRLCWRGYSSSENALMSNSEVCTVANDPRPRKLASGEIPFRATLFHTTGKANWLISWHQDMALPLAAKFDVKGWGPCSRKPGV